MEQVIKNYCENGKSSGLLLFEMPTGSGKTHHVLDYIYKASLDKKNKDRKYIFITTLKKNLPEEELKSRFINGGFTEKQFYEKFVFLDSNIEYVKDRLRKVRDKIPQSIKILDEYKKLENYVDSISTVKGQKVISTLEEELRLKVEPTFRKAVERKLREEGKTKADRIDMIQNDKDWMWLSELYPATLTSKKQIIFMSVDKFLAKNTTMVEPSYFIYSSNLIKDAVIFIDEFDATKDTVLKRIIEESIDRRIDYIELFKEIYKHLQESIPPNDLITSSKANKGTAPIDIIEGFKKRADEIYIDYKLQFNYKTDDDVVEANKSFLFHDHTYHTILKKDNSFISVKNDSKRNLNRIYITQAEPRKDRNNIQIMLGKIRGFIKYFSIGVKMLAYNYKQVKDERRKFGEEEFTFESAIRSILEQYISREEYIDMLTEDILLDSHRNNEKKERTLDLSFYENGFRYFAFEDDPNHDMQSRIMMFSFQKAPEKILLSVCERAKVIGISATAAIPSAVGNYDIDYLKMKLKDSFVTVSKEDFMRMNTDFENSQKGYDSVKIHVELLGKEADKEYSQDSWKLVFDSDELAQHIFEKLETEVIPNDSGDKDYDRKRYLRVALAYKNYLLHDDIKSFLCVLTKHPRVNDRSLDWNTLIYIFKSICRECGMMFEKNNIYQLDGDEYDFKKDEVTAKLANGEKLFVISVYQTIGAGQNLQYKIPEGLEKNLIKINEFGSRGEKDFDAIYLDKPTNLLVNLGNNLSTEDFAKYLFQVEFLQENGELSTDATHQHIKRAFQCYIDQNNYHLPPANVGELYSSRSVKLLSTRTIIQAIGRICRTNMKNRNIYIYADSRIADYIDILATKGRMLNKEFKSLIEQLNISDDQSFEEQQLCYKAQLTSERGARRINNMLYEDWSEESIENWKNLREYALKNPTVSSKEFIDNPIAHNFYVELPEKGNKLFYAENNDFKRVKVSFSPTQETRHCESGHASRLDQILKIPCVRNYFAKNEYATSFLTNDCIMSPVMFHNFYKGALGEAAGKAIFEENGIRLDDITDPDIFELFDFKISGNPVYVDFKNWGNYNEDFDQTMLKITEKAGNISDCKRVLIVNIMSSNPNWKTHSYDYEKVKVMLIPYLYLDVQEGTVPTFSLDYFKQIREFINGTN